MDSATIAYTTGERVVHPTYGHGSVVVQRSDLVGILWDCGDLGWTPADELLTPGQWARACRAIPATYARLAAACEE